MTKKEAERNRNSAKPVVEAFDVISGGKWRWEPEVFELFLNADTLYCAEDLSFTPEAKEPVIIEQACDINGNHHGPFFPEDCFPVFPWEIIEEIVCSFGFEIGGPWWHTRGKDEYEFGIFRPKGHWTGFGKNRYESVVDSLLELAKDLKKK